MTQHVHADGRAERIQDGVMRARFRDGFDRPSLLEPGKPDKYHIDLWFTSPVIPDGDRLRVTVASAAFPKYDRNINTGGDNERYDLRSRQPADSSRRGAQVVRAAADCSASSGVRREGFRPEAAIAPPQPRRTRTSAKRLCVAESAVGRRAGGAGIRRGGA